MQQHGSKYFAGRSHHDPRDQKVTMQLFQNSVMLPIELKRIAYAATWSQIFCLQTPNPLTLGMGAIGQKSTSSEHSYVAYQIKGNHEMQHYGRKYFVRRPPFPHDRRRWDQKVNVQFSEQWHLAYQIKLNYECSNMLGNILPAEPTPDPGVGFKCQNPFFQNMVMLHVK